MVDNLLEHSPEMPEPSMDEALFATLESKELLGHEKVKELIANNQDFLDRPLSDAERETFLKLCMLVAGKTLELPKLSFSGINLSSVDFSRTNLQGCDFTGAIGITWAQLAQAKDIRHCKFSGIDFTGTDLSGLDLYGCDFAGATGITWAQLAKAEDITYCKFSGIDFTGADLSGLELYGCDFTGAIGITWAQLAKAEDTRYCKFAGIDFTGASLAGLNLYGCDFTGAIGITWVQIAEAKDICDCKFSGIDFTGASLAGLNLEACDFTGAKNLTWAQIAKAKDIRFCKFSGIDFTGVSLAGLNLYGCDFAGAIGITWAQLAKAEDITYCKFAGIDFTDADLTGCDLEDCNFRGAVNLTAARFVSCTNLESAKFNLSPEEKTRLRFWPARDDEAAKPYIALIGAIYQAAPGVLDALSVGDLDKIYHGDCSCLQALYVNPTTSEKLKNLIFERLSIGAKQSPEFQEVFSNLQKHFGDKASETQLLQFIKPHIFNPHEVLLNLTDDRIAKFSHLYWKAGQSGQAIDEEALSTGKSQGDSVLLQLMNQVANSNYTDILLGDEFACFAFILDNFKDEPEFIERLITGYEDDYLKIPPNAMSGFNKFLEAIRATRVLESGTLKESLLAIKEKDPTAYYFFVQLTHEPLVNISAVEQAIKAYLENDDAFWRAGSSHTPPVISDALKVSNYFEVGGSGLSIQLNAQSLMQGMIHGWFDELNLLKPLAISDYRLMGFKPKGKKAWDALQETFNSWLKNPEAFYQFLLNPKKNLGSDVKKNLMPLVDKCLQDALPLWLNEMVPKENLAKLTDKEWIEKLKGQGFLGLEEGNLRLDDVIKALSEKANFSYFANKSGFTPLSYENLSPEQHKYIKEQAALFQQQLTGVTLQFFKQKGATATEIKSQVINPSDPLAVVKGSGTASCDPFGDGKVNFYNISPNCAAMTVTFVNPETGQETVFCQSTITVNKKGLEVLWRKMAAGLSNESASLNRISVVEALGPDFLKTFMDKPDVIVIDNIEANKGRAEAVLKLDKNFILERYSQVAEALQDQYGGAAVDVGSENSDYLPGKDVQATTSGSLQALIYTDAGKVVSLYPPQKEKQLEYLKAIKEKVKRSAQPLTSAFTVPVAYLQEKVYQQVAKNTGTQLAESFVSMQNTIAAAELAWANYFKSRGKEIHNPSSVVFDKDGVPTGYLLCYPAKLEASIKAQGVEIQEGASVIYVHDIAMNSENKDYRLVGFLAERLFQEAAHFDEPIVADVRRETSLKLLQVYEKQKRITIHEVKELGNDMVRVVVKKGEKFKR